MAIDTQELRRKVNSTDAVDHIDLHANIKPFLSELLDRLEAAEEDRSNFIVEMGNLCAQCDALRAKIEAMEKQGPAGWQRLYEDGSSTEDIVDSPNVFAHQRPLYTLPGAKGEQS